MEKIFIFGKPFIWARTLFHVESVSYAGGYFLGADILYSGMFFSRGGFSGKLFCIFGAAFFMERSLLLKNYFFEKKCLLFGEDLLFAKIFSMLGTFGNIFFVYLGKIFFLIWKGAISFSYGEMGIYMYLCEEHFLY